MTVRVLVVHSHPADLAVIASVAAAQGFDLCVTAPTADVVGLACQELPDAVILDVDQLDAFALLARLRADQRTAGIPVIAITTSDNPEVRRLAFAAGADDVLEKPVQRHDLAHKLHSFARLRRAWLAAWAGLQD